MGRRDGSNHQELEGVAGAALGGETTKEKQRHWAKQGLGSSGLHAGGHTDP